VSTTPEQSPDPAARLREARLAGYLKLAFGEVSSLLSSGAATPAALAEAVRVLVAADQPGTAMRLHAMLAAAAPPGAGHALEPEVLARLALQIGQRGLLEGLPAVTAPAWLVALQRDGHDLVSPFVISDLKVTVANGPAVYAITGACPHCGHGRAFELRANLMVRVDGLCPSCFGGYEVAWEALRAFLLARFPDLLADRARDADWELVEHVRHRLLEADDVPELVRALGQEYHFLLNEIIACRLMDDANADGGQCA
jgi:hypothetical protein